MAESEMSDSIPQNLLWLDLEMTGLDAKKDLITEIAVVVTDFSFKILTEYNQGIYHPPAILKGLLERNEWFQEQASAYQADIYAISAKGILLAKAETDLIDIANKYFKNKNMILAGNSICTDRGFVDSYLPRFALNLHYRMLDVTAYKIYVQAVSGLRYDKQEAHRALDDIYESIAELKFCLQKIKQL